MTKTELNMIFLLIRTIDDVTLEVLLSKRMKKLCGKKIVNEYKERHKKLKKKFIKLVKKSQAFNERLTEIEETELVLKINKHLEKYKRFSNDIMRLSSSSGDGCGSRCSAIKQEI